MHWTELQVLQHLLKDGLLNKYDHEGQYLEWRKKGAWTRSVVGLKSSISSYSEEVRT